MEDADFKMKYVKCKWKVKKWESEFKQEHGINPSKNDIKNAPSSIKEAYKKYYTLKTMALENSLRGSAIEDEDTMDAFSTRSVVNINNTDLAGLNNSIEESNIVDTGKKKCTEVGLDLNNGIHRLPDRNFSIKENVQEKEKDIPKMYDSNKVWGPHLSKKHKEKKPVSVVPSSTSLSYTAKLFAGAKFNKRNPRKSHSFTKTKKTNNSNNDCTKIFHSENSLSSYEPKMLLPKSLKAGLSQHLPDNVELPDCNLVNNKVKIIKTSLAVVTQPVGIMQKTLKDENNELISLRKLDTGWVERAANSNLLEIEQISNLSHSGIDLNDSVRFRAVTSTSDASDDEDIIYGSDSEMESKNKSNILSISCKRNMNSSITMFDDRPNKRKCEFNNLPSTENSTVMVKNLSDNSLVPETEDMKNDSTVIINKCPYLPNKSTYNVKDLNIISTTLVDEKYLSNNSTDPTATENTKRKISGASLVEQCSSLLDCKSKAEKKAKTARSKPTLQESLEKKMASGKANENFVKVNVQKKIYVRGKKTMTFSKFKKKQWKANVKSLYGKGGQSGVLKCFKCGDVGHFSRTCMKENDQLLPHVEDNDEDDCPFPTLEEAKELAKECSERLHIKRKDFVQVETSTINGSVDVEEDKDKADLLVQPEPIENMILQSCVDPIFQLNEDNTLIETPLLVMDTLIKFGHEKFRSGQEQVIMRILSGLSTLVTLATGTGKSLCYQLPAYIYYKHRNAITLVVSPLLSLMEDQVAKSSACLKMACLHSGQTPKKRELILEQLKNNKIPVLLVSPEAVVQGERLGINNFLRHLPPIAFACVDEAHCVSQWSHNFRPTYLSIFQVLREKLGIKTILGLTATATISVMSSIADHIGVPDGVHGIIRDIPLPDNLILSVSKENKKDIALITLLKGPRFSSCESIIVYCTRREECERLAAFLRTCLQDVNKDGVCKKGKIMSSAESYHAGLSSARRQQIQNAFMAGKLRIVIATVAFGMGINKRDIRGIIHYNMPSSFESYVQEVGRAGRDGLPAYCHLFLDSEGRDLNELRRHIYANSTERHTIRKLLQKVFVPCHCKDDCVRHEVAFSHSDTVEALDLRQENIATLLCYLELHKQNWVQVLSPVYTLCRIHSYKGAKYLKKAAKECAPLAMAIAMELKRSNSRNLDKLTKLEFSVYEVSAAINWDCGVVKHHLKNLEWTKVNDQPKRSGLLVELTDLGFRIRAPGNLNSDELDAALDNLYKRVKVQENMSLKKLQAVFQAFIEASYKRVEDCLEDMETERCERLKSRIRDYFSKEGMLEDIPLPEESLENEDQIVSDIHNLICSYRDCSFTGRAIARIFHGIESPNFPSVVWYKCRYWRQHLGQNFNSLCKLATRELLRMRL